MVSVIVDDSVKPGVVVSFSGDKRFVMNRGILETYCVFWLKIPSSPAATGHSYTGSVFLISGIY